MILFESGANQDVVKVVNVVVVVVAAKIGERRGLRWRFVAKECGISCYLERDDDEGIVNVNDNGGGD